MKSKAAAAKRPIPGDPPQHTVHLPEFIRDTDIGLGDAIKRATSYIGIAACAGCRRRADALNRWMVFTNRHSQ